jgi:CelD/BcsL family acetyltransferase involved in cellulose biosynthesis
MPTYRLNPLLDRRWGEFVETHPLASVFHTPAWIEALTRTYGYKASVFTTSPPDVTLNAGIPVLAVRSWINGRRLVSMPFSDHCEPLVQCQRELDILLSALAEAQEEELCRYIEVRPTSALLESQSSLAVSATFYLHKLDLRPTREELFDRFHKDSIQRKLRRAEREGLTIQQGTSRLLIDQFYSLMLRTRRRHQLPPQPRDWFYNLAACFADKLNIRIAFKDGRAVAAILTLRHRTTVVYKYGASDERFHSLGGMPFLFWEAIKEAKGSGAEVLDLGRSEPENAGLITFKERLGAVRYPLTYWRSGGGGPASQEALSLKLAKYFFRILPDGALTAVGKILYRHMG